MHSPYCVVRVQGKPPFHDGCVVSALLVKEPAKIYFGYLAMRLTVLGEEGFQASSTAYCRVFTLSFDLTSPSVSPLQWYWLHLQSHMIANGSKNSGLTLYSKG